jgi:serine phosphatase RsbU (regulator of sigma subunit)
MARPDSSETPLPAGCDPLLIRQLRKAGLADPLTPPDAATWTVVLDRISAHYKHADDDRALLTRSLELISRETEQLRGRLAAERDRLHALVEAIGESLAFFVDLIGTGDLPAPETVGRVRADFVTHISGVIAAHGDPEAGEQLALEARIRDNFLHLADQFIRFLRDAADRGALKKQLEVAGAVQAMLVPTGDLIDRGFVKLAGFFQPAAECGGDWWSVYDLPGGGVMVVIGDVTGHGVSSAIITGVAKAACDMAHLIWHGGISCEELLQMMNVLILQAARTQLIMTCAVAVFDPRTRSMRFANAGHPFPFQLRRGEALRPVISRGSPLGFQQVPDLTTVEVAVERGDVFVWYTDGLVECENSWREPFGDRRLRRVLADLVPTGAVDTRDAIAGAVARFHDGHAAADDVTFVAVEVAG